MARFNVKTMTVNELVERFVAIALDQDKALFNDEIAKFSKLYGQMDTVRNELKSRPGDQRSALLPLYTHPNIQVRLKAALTTMEVAPEAAREVFEKIADSRHYASGGRRTCGYLASRWKTVSAKLASSPAVTRSASVPTKCCSTISAVHGGDLQYRGGVTALPSSLAGEGSNAHARCDADIHACSDRNE